MSIPFASIQQAMASGETLIFGHRGAMASAPMNTMASFAMAYEQGAHGIELDAQLSADDEVVVIHDFSVDETSGGEGPIREKTLSELKRLDVGSWFSDDFQGERIPTLDEVFSEFGQRMLINVEIKSSGDSQDKLARHVLECISRRGMVERTLVSSFDPQVLQHIGRLMPSVMLGHLTVPGMTAENALPLNHQARHPWHEMVDDSYMAWAREKGNYVNVWTVNDPVRALELRALGVNAIITDVPSALLDSFA